MIVQWPLYHSYNKYINNVRNNEMKVTSTVTESNPFALRYVTSEFDIMSNSLSTNWFATIKKRKSKSVKNEKN